MTTTTKKSKPTGASTGSNGAEKAPKAEKVTAAYKDVNEMMTESTEAIEKAYKAGTEIATENYEKMVAMAQENVEAAVKAGSAVFKDYDDMAGFSKKNVDAFVKSGTLWAQGMQDFGKIFSDMTRLSMEKSVVATQAFMSCKTLADVAKLNNEIVKKNYDQAIEDSRKLTDMSIKLTEEVTSPIAEQYNTAVDKITKSMAA
ncbi:MAG: phasin family protein [Rhodospirillales bacterium]